MKALFISYNQAYNEEIVKVLEQFGQRGYTKWIDVHGRGSVDGNPHLDNHAWPQLNNVVISMVDDDKVDDVLDALKAKDEAAPDLGLRAFVWNVEKSL